MVSSRRPRGFRPQTIREALYALEGEAWLNPDVYDWIRTHVDLTEQELALSRHQKRLNYVHTVRCVASDMVNRGELIRLKAGFYRLP